MKEECLITDTKVCLLFPFYLAINIKQCAQSNPRLKRGK